MYAWVNAKKNSGIYRSDDAGESWQQVNGEERIYGRGDDFGCVQVDPRNKDTIYVANTSTYRSTDGGKTFTAIKGAPGGEDVYKRQQHPHVQLARCLAPLSCERSRCFGGLLWFVQVAFRIAPICAYILFQELDKSLRP